MATRRKPGTEVVPLADVALADDVPFVLTASALRMNFDDASYTNYRFRDETWQRELWRFYDIIPELRFAANWIGSACSKVDIFVAEVDKLGRVQGRAKRPAVAALSDTLLGGPAARAEAIRMAGINLTIAGECYILGKPRVKDSEKDKWYILSSSEIRRVKGGQIFWGDKKYYEEILDLTKSMVTRVWTPHPQRIWCADSSARACQAILRELEQLTKYVFSQIDSRLAGAGMLVIPNNLDFPLEDGVDTQGESLMIRMATAMAASLKGDGTAMALVPLIIEADPEDIERSFKLITFASELSKQAVELRDEAIRRLSLGMDIAPEILTGQGDMNHWSSWFVDEATVKLHIEPLMNRLCDALTTAYLTPALKIMGLDPRRFVYSFDTSPLTIRPQRLQDALNLFDKGAIGYEALRVAGYFKESDAPSPEQLATAFAKELMLRDPNLAQQPGWRHLAGITDEMLPTDSLMAPVPGGIDMGGGGGAGAPPPPVPPSGIASEIPMATPGGLSAPPGAMEGGNMPGAGGGITPQSITAGAAIQGAHDMGVIIAAHATVLRGLELAGQKLRTRSTYSQYPELSKHEIHTVIPARDRLHAVSLLEGCWTHLPTLLEQFDAHVTSMDLRQSLTRYCSVLLTEGIEHDPVKLIMLLQQDGHVGGGK
jgi:hypothetical protein